MTTAHAAAPEAAPTLSLPLTKEAAKRVAGGYPWIFKGDVVMSSALELAEPGELALVLGPRAEKLGVAYFSPRVALCARMLSANAKERVDEAFFVRRFAHCLSQREGWIGAPYYRLAFAESDGLPGLIVDRFGDYLSCQVTTAGMWRLRDLWVGALQNLLGPRGIVLDHSDEFCRREGMPVGVDVVGVVPPEVELREHGRVFFANLVDGQKTGWFFDQRANHHYVHGLARGKTVLDLFTHSGGFGIAAACGGAIRVVMVDRSQLALDLAAKSAQANGVGLVSEFVRADVFKDIAARAATGEQYDLLIADPPAFIQSRTHIRQGLAGYGKLARGCAPLVRPGGVLCIASCSHFAHPDTFRQTVEKGFAKAGRSFRRIFTGGADRDHAPHPQLPESSYLKFLAYEMS